jgi:hypothetical protein
VLDAFLTVVPGTAFAQLGERDQLRNQDSAIIRGMAEADDLFGSPVAAGDFDGDDYDDLAIGVLAEDLGATANTGHAQCLTPVAGG